MANQSVRQKTPAPSHTSKPNRALGLNNRLLPSMDTAESMPMDDSASFVEEVIVEKSNNPHFRFSSKEDTPTVHSTISKDLSNGIAAQAKSNLQSLAKRRGPVNLVSTRDGPPATLTPNLFQSQETKASKATTDKITIMSEPWSYTPDSRSRDYQMQVVLDEEQNPWRSPVASPIASGNVDDGPTHLNVLDDKNSTSAAIIEYEERVDKLDIPADMEGEGVRPNKRQRRGETQSDYTVINPQRTPGHGPVPVTSASGSGPGPVPELGHHRTIYAIHCFERPPVEKTYHSALWFEDIPTRKSPSSMHLEGDQPVHFLESGMPCQQTSFLVIKEFYCHNPTPFEPGTHPTEPRTEESILVQSQALKNTLKAVASYDPDVSNRYNFSRSARLSAPYVFLYHHRRELVAHGQRAGPCVLGPVQDMLRHLHMSYRRVFAVMDRQISEGIIDDETMPYLYRPNEILISNTKGVETAYVLREPDSLFTADDLTLHCWEWSYDGFWLRRKNQVLTVNRPQSEPVPISSLSTYPLRFAKQEVKDRLISRGRKFWGFRYIHHVSYSGWDAKAEEFYPTETRCMIDYRTFKKFHPGSPDLNPTIRRPLPYDSWPVTLPHDKQLSDSEVLLLPPIIHGFILKQKHWSTLLVDNVSAVTWNKTAFDRLVLKPSTKELIKALVMIRIPRQGDMYRVNFRWKRDDLIAGKGSGLIMLLHGGPGTGKTLTAESVAEIAEMPLYRVTCGDIGTTTDAVEKYLDTILHLGKTWNCVLLLDEADVFLEERSLSDLDRNGLVSVFLRILEYYDGILVLTTNRVGTFDEAFQSRIQVAIPYPDLDRLSRKRIWQNFFDILRADDEDADVDELVRRIDELAENPMNGRQIRNVLTTARQLALYKQETLVWGHLDQAVTMAREFGQYLQNVHGHSDDQWAREGKLR